MRYIIPVLGALLILVISCEPPVSLTKPTVTAQPISAGDTLRLTWTAVNGATGYNIYLDGVKHQVQAGTYSYDVPGPVKKIEVSAYDASEESDKWELVTTIEKTANIIVYTTADVGNPNHAFYFNASGTAVAIPLSQATDIDFVLDTSGTAANIEIRSPSSYTPKYNNKDNATATATTTDFDALKDAPAPGVYNTVRQISANALYSLWIDPTGDGWSVDDHFGKLKIENISGTAVTMTAGYQKTGGLRWLISQ
ncbi:MAG: hypothetical protein ABIK62_07545 [candidate division WOR-3 bacterium]